MSYIRVPAVWDKLREAEESFRPVLMLANAGYGKTSAAVSDPAAGRGNPSRGAHRPGSYSSLAGPAERQH